MLEIVASPEEVDEILLSPLPSPPQTGPAPVVSYSIPWPDVSLIAFLRQAANAPRIYWESDKVAMGFAGCGVTAKLTADGPRRFQTIRQSANRLFEHIILLNNDAPAAIGPRLFGGFAFRAEHQPRGLWTAFPTACFILPHYQLTRFEGQAWLTVNHRLGPEDDPMGIEHLLRDEVQRLTGSEFLAPGRSVTPEHRSQSCFEQLKLDLPGLQHVATNNGVAPSTIKLNGRESRLSVTDLMEPRTWHDLVTTATRYSPGPAG
jgi:isochorismate synthase EntC